MTLNIVRLSSVLLLGLLLAPATASAANPGVDHGRMMISAERLFGLSFSHTSVDNGNGSNDRDVTHFGLVVSPNTAVGNIYTTPRLAFDIAVIDGLTVGGSLGVSVTGVSDSSTTGGTSAEVSRPTLTTVLIAPRAGYVLGFTRVVGLWLRGGLTYFNGSAHSDATVLGTNATRTDTLWGLGLDLEPTLLVSPFEHFSFTAGLVLDLPLAGKQSVERTAGNVTTTTSTDASVRNIGVVAGMVISF
jgi:hypothetical protein